MSLGSENFDGSGSAMRSYNSQRLQNTIEHITSQWIPCHPQLRSRLHNMCLRRSLDRANLVSFLMGDPGLCMYVLRSLRKAFPAHDSISLRTAFAEIELEKLAEIACVSDTVISSHDYLDASRHQTSSLRQSVYTTRAASVFAERSNIDQTQIQFAAFSREIGCLLLSWSYPRLYARAMSRKRMSRTNLSVEIQRLIGVTPEDVGTEILKHCRIAFDIEDSSESSQIGTEQILDLAQIWGRSQDQGYFPEAQKEWKKAEPLIKDVFGEDVIDEINSVCEKSFSPHSVTLGNQAHDETNNSREHEANFHPDIQNSKNLSKLPFTDKQLISEALAFLDYPETAKEGLKKLVDNIVPELGFLRGCVFILAKDGDGMLPVLRFGDLPARRYNELEFDRLQGFRPFIFQSVPFSRSREGYAGNEVIFVCGGLDSPNYQGVLYLERALDQGEADAESRDISLCFRCLREILVKAFDLLS